MSSFIRMVLQVGEDANSLDKKLALAANKPQQSLQNISALIAALAGNTQRGANMKIAKDAVRATITGTFTGDPTADQALTLNGVAFTAKASGATGNQWNIATGANAAPLVAAINGSSSAKIRNVIKAEVVSAQVFRVTCLIPGTIGNLCTITENMDNFTIEGSATALAGGTEDQDVELAVGLPAETSA